MNRFNGLLQWARSILVVSMLALALGACSGDDGLDGLDGAAGPAGADGPPGPEGPPGPGADAIDMAKVESCGTCHSGVGDGHQAEYDKYSDASNLDLSITSVTSAGDGAGGFDGTMTIHVERDGVPVSGMSSWTSRGNTVWGPYGMSQMSFYTVGYDDTTKTFDNSRSFSMAETGDQGGGNYILTSNSTFNPVPVNGQAYGYVVADPLHTEGMTLYDNVANASVAYGNVGNYESAANVEGCEACHGAPYMKHGYREAAVTGLPDFAACKSCHYDTRGGNHEDWQYMVDEPFNWATDEAATADYSYIANVMNDTHMSHAMEFPYPQSMANCATCHEGQLVDLLDDTNFTAETCQSCHPVQGIDAWPGEDYAQSLRAPPLEYLWQRGPDLSFHDVETAPNCQGCHGAGIAGSFTTYHNGYDAAIYDDAGQRYSDLYPVLIDQVTLAGNLLTVNFSGDATLAPELLISFYGYDSKQFIVASHSSDGSLLCISRSGNPGGCRMEFAPGDTNPLFAEDAASVPGAWMVTLDMAAYVPTATLPDDIPTLIADGVVKMAEVTVTSELVVGDVEVALDAVTQTFDLGASLLVDDYFKGANATVDTAKCNVCHDALATTFHSGSGRGGDIVACKNCHVTTSPGSHLEMASRAIDSYVHAIHSFQPFDLDDVDTANDPVEDARTALHMEHTFPNFTITNCESCHVAGTFNVPDQAQSMPGVLRASWDIADRNIGNVPEAVTGPASRACGGCHRVEFINEDLAGDLAAFNAHTEAFGTYVENDADDFVLYGIIDKIMSLFE